eukprot:31435-Pelagococcus_subviridis.AAC.13
MQKIEHRAVRSVDRHERPLQKAPVVALEVRDVHVRVLQPRVQNEPEVTHEVRAHVERDDGPDASGGGGERRGGVQRRQLKLKGVAGGD